MSGVEYTIEVSVDGVKWTLYSHVDTNYNGIAKNFICEGTLEECETRLRKLNEVFEALESIQEQERKKRNQRKYKW